MPKLLFSKEYEDYLITGDESSINSLPSGSIEKEYFLIIQKLLKEDLTQELETKIESFTSKITKEQSYRLKALHIYKKLKQNPENKEEIIQEIKSLFNIKNAKIYSKPVKYNKTTDSDKEENEAQKLPHELIIENYILTDKFIQDIYKGKIIPDNKEFKKYFSGTLVLNLDFNKIPENTLVKIFTTEKEFEKINDSIGPSFKLAKLPYFQNVLTEQIEYLLTFKSQFNFESLILELIERKYPIQPEDKKERIKILKEIKALLNYYKYKNDKMTRDVLLSILELNSEINIYEFYTFIEYVEVPMFDDTSLYNITPKIKEQIKANNKQKELNVQIIKMEEKKEKKLIEKCLKHFFLRDKITYDQLSKYFNEKYLKDFYSKMKFYSGEEQPFKDKILYSSDIENLMKEIQLTICDYNKEKFAINEDIELNLEIKNIQTLYVNIYEINTENYYYSNKSDFDYNISLDGIVPTFKDKFTFNEKPQLIVDKKIPLIKLPKKRGLFVVELIGNGHVSRAVIQRGYLKCIHKNTVNGKVFYILDEENKILKGEKTGLWINNIWYSSIKETGAILIPYSVKGNILILKHDEFCFLEKGIDIPEEKYEFNGQFIINEESFIMGNLTKILVRPYLYVCDEICPLENLKNIKLTINTIKTENNEEIPSTNVINNAQLSYDKEYSFEFQVPPKLKNVEFILSGDIQFKTINKKETLSFSKKYYFNRGEDYDVLIKKNDEGNFIFDLLGRNGEPKCNHQISLKLSHKIQQEINKDNPILLESDSEGKIDLGKLTDINKCKIDSYYYDIEKLPKHVYLPNINILENQEINLPFINKDNNRITLMKISQEKASENLSDLIKIDITDKLHNLGNLTLPKLSKGEYSLDINDNKIFIKVIKGKVMDIKDFIVLENGNIKYNNNNESPITVENFIPK